MKNILIILLILGSWGASAQSFVSTDKLWSTMKGPVSGCSSFFCSSYFTKFVGDTVIGETHYLKVMRSEDRQMTNWDIEGFIREDSAQKVYYRDKLASVECLLYDFGCEVGDTLQLNCGCNRSGYLVDSIKTVTTDSPRKYYYLTYLEMKSPEVWIEGIGSTMGILNAGGWGHCLTGGMGEALLCFFESGIKKYQSSEFPNFCFLSKDIIDGTYSVKADSYFKVYPNPATNELLIRFSQATAEDCKLELFSLKGELVKTQCLDAGTSLYRLDIGEFKSGTYILRLGSNSGKYEDNEIVIKK